MVTKTSQAFKHQQSESATSFANLSERDLKKYLKINNKTRPRKALTGAFLRSRVSSNFRQLFSSYMIENKQMIQVLSQIQYKYNVLTINRWIALFSCNCHHSAMRKTSKRKLGAFRSRVPTEGHWSSSSAVKSLY